MTCKQTYLLVIRNPSTHTVLNNLVSSFLFIKNLFPHPPGAYITIFWRNGIKHTANKHTIDAKPDL